MTDFHIARIRRAKKKHRCEHCGGTIQPGEEHIYAVQVWQGYFDTNREHQDCREVWLHLNGERGWDCDGTPFLSDDEWELDEQEWVIQNHPQVAARLGWKREEEE